MLLYLDLNCFNRPFDDQSQVRIAEETEAVFLLLGRIEEGEDQMVWSAVLEFENSQHPLADRREEIGRWAQVAQSEIAINEALAERARVLADTGIHAMDAAHLAIAEAARCDCLVTCDDRMMRSAAGCEVFVSVQNPIDYMRSVSDG